MQYQEEFQAIHREYGTRVIDLSYPKFANGGLQWPLYSPALVTPCEPLRLFPLGLH